MLLLSFGLLRLEGGCVSKEALGYRTTQACYDIIGPGHIDVEMTRGHVDVRMMGAQRTGRR